MKKTLSLLTGLLLAASSFAELSQLTLSISTPGPDTYADGTPVLVGETYLLVYVSQGSVFGGLYSDGTLVDPVNNKVATKAYAVEGARCGFKAIQYPPALFPAGGSWVIVVLDTRKDSGSVGGLVAGQGAGGTSVAASSQSTSLSAVGAGAGGTLTATGATRALASTPAPEITAVQPNGGAVNVRFKNFSDKAIYEVQTKSSLASGDWQPATGALRVQASAQTIVQGQGGADELPATVQVEPGEKIRFFRVIVKGSN